MNKPISTEAGPVPAADNAASLLAGAVEAAIADLESRVSDGMGPLEQALAARIRAAAARLLDCAAQLATDELLILGSTGQRRPHPLLKIEQDLRREIGDGLEKLTFRAEQGAMITAANALTRGRSESE